MTNFPKTFQSIFWDLSSDVKNEEESSISTPSYDKKTLVYSITLVEVYFNPLFLIRSLTLRTSDKFHTRLVHKKEVVLLGKWFGLFYHHQTTILTISTRSDD